MKPIALSQHARERLKQRSKPLSMDIIEVIKRGIKLRPKPHLLIMRLKNGRGARNSYVWNAGYLFILDEKADIIVVVTVMQKKLRTVLKEYIKI